jgi:uncharacterized protein YdeI (BOF family)
MRRLTYLVAVLAASAASAAPIPIDQLSNGMTATISGKVDRITDEDEFVLSDASGSVLVYIGPGIVPFDVGETLTLNGIVDRELGRLEVYAREARRADGSVVTFDHRYE